MRKQNTGVAVLAAGPGETRQDTAFAQIVTLTGISADGSVTVSADADGPLVTARVAVPLSPAQLADAVARQQRVVVVFENGDRTLPLIVGLLQAGDLQQTAAKSTAPFVEADVDGRRVKVTAQDEIVLQCGPASITLRRNGRVIVRGTYVETHSDGTNRIKGGQVQIN